jgi:hypothetical protein
VAITKDVYGHLVEGRKRAAAVLMSAALVEGRGSPGALMGVLVGQLATGCRSCRGALLAHPERLELPTFRSVGPGSSRVSVRSRPRVALVLVDVVRAGPSEAPTGCCHACCHRLRACAAWGMAG